MLIQGSVRQLREKKIHRPHDYVVIVMCFYPRNLSKTVRDEYIPTLAPDRTLFKEWLHIARTQGHDIAFVETDYENRFHLSALAFAYLKRFSHEAEGKNLYFVCQCEVGERCHREMLLLAAAQIFQAAIGPVHHAYPKFMSRLDGLLKEANFNPKLDVRT